MQLIGTVLKRRYCILEKIGMGGQGALYLARDMDLGVNRAVKKMPASKKKEAKLMRLLSHPGLPQMIDYIEKEDCCYLVMEYIEGKNLKELEEQKWTFDEAFLFRFFQSAYEILRYLHEQTPSLVHGDVKPSNFMMTSQGFFYLVDFGSASVVYELPRNGLTGTPKYASERQCKGIISIENDIYSLGKTIYELMGKRKIWISAKNPSLAIAVRHCVKKGKLSQRDVEYLGGHLREKKARNKMTVHILCVIVVIVAGIGLYAINSETDYPFIQKLGEVTEIYRECVRSAIERNDDLPAEKLNTVEGKLKELLHNNNRESEQVRLLILLAYQSELIGQINHAKTYYEQIIRDYPEFEEGYVEYGLFLLRQGEGDTSKKIWDLYREHIEQMPDAETILKSGNAIAWEKWLHDAKIK
ncbi:MAG: serine/threonine-protein kinase [Eubacteriales bacterium]|nr:serine/threonine-protein kinase [Eubacteriales bacterium]